MPLTLTHSRRDLAFRFDARTSRGKIEHHTAHYLLLSHTAGPARTGWGEAAPLAGLSTDFGPGLEEKIQTLTAAFSAQNHTDFSSAKAWLANENLWGWPSLKFGLETAFLDFENGSRKLLFDTAFSRGETGIPINGLIWIGEEHFMQEQIKQKLAQGYTCLKLKIGGLDLETECRILASVRAVANEQELIIRLDANGAFTPENALFKLEKLAQFGIHSLEQPIKPGQFAAMEKICRESPIPIALDEELIGVTNREAQKQLISGIKPPYLIFKPTLLGGLKETANWIMLAEETGCGWWITSALESNIGLNAIAQFTSTYANLIPQGLGTGQLYSNNIPAALQIRNGALYYQAGKVW